MRNNTCQHPVVDDMTTKQIQQMLKDTEKERRRDRTENGRSPAQYGRRVQGKRHGDYAGNKGNLRKGLE